MTGHVADKADFGRIIDALKVIEPWRKKHRGTSHREVIECPCCKGKLHLSIAASNGHVWGKCETAGCLSWIE